MTGLCRQSARASCNKWIVANSADPEPSALTGWADQGSRCLLFPGIFWRNFSMEEQLNLHFREFTANLLSVQIFRYFMVHTLQCPPGS